MLTLFCLPVFSQDYREKEYNYFNGLPSDEVFFSFKSKNGLLFVTTLRGTVFFDGHKFVSIDGKRERINSFFFHKNEYYYEDGDALKMLSLDKTINNSVKIQKVINADSDPNNDHFENIFVDKSERIWCSDFNNVKFVKDFKVTSYLLFPKNNELKRDVRFAEISKNEIWISSFSGLFFWKEGKIDTFSLQEGFSAILKVDESTVLLATLSGKIIKINCNTRKVISELSVPENQRIIGFVEINNQLYVYSSTTIYQLKNNQFIQIHSLDNKKINHVFWDKQTRSFWISTNKGLIKLIPPKLGIELLRLPEISDFENSVISIVEDRENRMLALSKSGKIWRQRGASWELIFSNPNELTCVSLDITGGRILLTTVQGIYEFTHGKFEKLNLKNFSQKNTIRKSIVFFQELWILYSDQPIKRYQLLDLEPITSTYKNTSDFWGDNKWNDILVDNLGQLWLAGWMPKSFGICKYDPENEVFLDVSSKEFKNQRTDFVGDYYNRIGQGINNNLLFSAFGGFNVVNKSGKIIQTITYHEYPMEDSYITGISQDKNQNIFFATSEGLHILLKEKNRVVRINKMDGLPTNYLGNAYRVLSNGKIAMGFTDGIILVNPDEILKSSFSNQFFISQIMVNGKLRMTDNSTIRLSKNESNLTVYFSNLSYIEPSQLHYFYKFEGDNEWIDLGETAELSFNHLEPGTHKVQVKAVDYLQNEQDKKLNLKIIAEPPFLKSTLFKVILCLLAIGLIYGYFNFKLRQKTREIRYQNKVKEAEMKTLRTQMNPHFMFNTLNSINSFIIQHQTKEASKYLTSFSKLMRNILENSKHQLIPLSKEIQTLKLYMELESARLEDAFGYSIKIDPKIEQDLLKVPPMLVQPFVENSIWHGIAGKTEGGYINVEFKVLQDNFLEITITDNGIGRVKSQENKKHQNKKHKSYGVEITLERLNLFDEKNQMIIHDLYDEENHPTGTKVVLTLKTEENENDID